MKTTLLAAAAAIALSTAPAFAQSAITTQTPPNPNAQSYTPQSSVSLPAGAAGSFDLVCVATASSMCFAVSRLIPFAGLSSRRP